MTPMTPMTPIDPPPGLLDKVAEAIDDGLFRMHGVTSSCDHHPEAELVWDAVAEGLGLSEEMAEGCHVCAGLVPCDRYDEHRRRLVSRWEPQP